MRYLYNVLAYLAIPFILLRLLWRTWHMPAYGKRWIERFGFVKSAPHENGIWFHAVSLGETIAAVSLIQALLNAKPHLAITVTVMTPTGSERVQALLGDKVHHVYVPYDFPGAVKRFLRRIKPKVAVIMETELWPNLLHYANTQGVALMLANGRLSQQSAKGYGYVPSLVQPMLQCFSYIAVQSDADSERFLALGAQKKQIAITGNLKYDLRIASDMYEQAKQLRQMLGKQRPVWIAASTHSGEEEKILAAFKKVQEQCPQTLLVLVPRHPERFDTVATLCKKQGFTIARRSQQEHCLASTSIYLGDTIGELLLMYGACDVAFVGGSLVPVGGHNLLEPAAFAKPTLTGPYHHNFVAVNKLLQRVGAVKQVDTVDALAETVIFWLTNKDVAYKIGIKGQQAVAENGGALDKHMALIQKLRNSSAPSKKPSSLGDLDSYS